MLKEVLPYIIFSILGLLIGIIVFTVVVPLLRLFKAGQSIRKEGPAKHLSKSGTPTMGGIVIVIITMLLFISSLLIYNKDIFNVDIFLLIIPVLGFALIGFLDDFLIIVKKNNAGLSPTLKFILQLIISVITYILLLGIKKNSDLNFFGTKINIAFLYGIIIVIGYSGVTNATNLTDGLDGLLTGCSIITISGILIMAIYQNNQLVIYFALSLITALIAFAFFNFPKATIFMGDVGSLAIGAAIFSMLILLNAEILFIFFGFIYFVETVSVMLQVWFFKRTKGDRIFLMTPLHHHFELLGLKEEEIDVVFWLVTFIFTVIGVLLGVRVFL